MMVVYVWRTSRAYEQSEQEDHHQESNDRPKYPAREKIYDDGVTPLSHWNDYGRGRNGHRRLCFLKCAALMG